MTLTNSPSSHSEENGARPGEFEVWMVVMIIANLFWWDGFATAFAPVLAPLLGR